MRHEQLIRINRAQSDKIFLLEKIKEDIRGIFKVCGTTKNVYNVTVYFNSGKIFCNCPDGRGYCKNAGVFCKHVCFIILKVFSKLFSIEESNIFDVLLFTRSETTNIDNFLSKELQYDPSIMDETLLTKFSQMKKEKDKKEITIDMIKDLECPICYDEFENIEIIECRVCHKIFHKECMSIWLSNSTVKNCPYCRSPINDGFYMNLEIN